MEYKAISQASYKFTSTRETTIQGADVLNSGFRFGTIKTTDGKVLNISSSGSTGSYTTKGISLSQMNLSTNGDNNGYSNGKLYDCTIDGKTYYGTKCYGFNLGSPYNIGYGGLSGNFTLANGTLKVLRYDSSIENIVLDEYSTNNKGNISISQSYQQSSYIKLEIYKQTDDVILAVWWEEETTETASE